ncbi:MAG: trypsin-like serine protease [Burkholderiales bacterium]|nr:trypsin-like serine protease [Burkholderiales bacterium]
MNRIRLHAVALAATLSLTAGAVQAYQNTAGGSTFMLRAEAILPEPGSPSALIVAGDPNGVPPDSPTLRIDPNVPTSPWSGVVSINIRYSTGTVGSASSFICSGAFVSPIHIVTAAHCIDTGAGNGTGTPIVIGDRLAGVAGVGDVRAVFNTPGTPGAAGTFTLGSAVSVAMHSNYKGFGVCPAAVTNPSEFCINDDIAVITMAQAAPEWVKIYSASTVMPGMGTAITHVGFGTTGNGVTGHTANSSSFFIKRTGAGHADRPLDELDDEQNFSGVAEIWSSDFDGGGKDTHCSLFGVCSPGLANNVETTLGGGDSGGPSFAQDAQGNWLLVGNNTFGRRFSATDVSGSFGTAYGGMILGAYQDFLETATNGQINFVTPSAIPEPGTYAMMALGLLGLGAVARRRKA